ncbi:MAG TPA: recombination protein RecR [Candidatus Latescibacteria bacterium]|nr:recombination protein RecR [Candidatus Latescibacterota bacterium]
MRSELDPVAKLTAELEKLPGIGARTAQRLAFHLMKVDKEEALALAQAIVNLREEISYCSVCFNLTDRDPCRICSDPKRDTSTICVVEQPRDVWTIEGTSQYRGLYHVLGGVIAPLEDVGPEDLRIKELVKRVRSGVKEVILAVSAGTEGQMTALYIHKLLKPSRIKISQIARGVPVGGDLDMVDGDTLAQAIKGRQEMTPPARE